MDKLDFDNRLYHLYQLMPDSETDGQRLAGCSVDQMFDDMFDSQVTDRYEVAFDAPPFNTYKEK